MDLVSLLTIHSEDRATDACRRQSHPQQEAHC
jgi:hypothetical protein